jgi:transposase-like protein
LRRERTISEIAADHEINPAQPANRRREFLEKAPAVSDSTRDERKRKLDEREKVESDFLLAARFKMVERRGALTDLKHSD